MRTIFRPSDDSGRLRRLAKVGNCYIFTLLSSALCVSVVGNSLLSMHRAAQSAARKLLNAVKRNGASGVQEECPVKLSICGGRSGPNSFDREADLRTKYRPPRVLFSARA